MTTPPNPPSTPTGPPTEPAGTPAPEAAPIPAPAQPLSLEKTPAAAPAAAEAPVAPEAPEAPAAPAAAEAPVAPEAPEVPAAPAAPAAEPAPAASAFAPPAPAPAAPAAPFGAYAAPGAPGHGGPGGPGDPWGRPGAGFGAGPYPGYPQATAPTSNGLAVAALIVGGFGILFGFVPLLFWLGGILALTGVGLGIGAIVRANKGAPNKTMAIVGTVLAGVGILASIGGFFLTVAFVERASDRVEAGIDEYEPDTDGLYPTREPRPSASPSPSQVPGLTSALVFGETFTYPNGVKVSLSKPTKYEPKGIIAREQVKNAVQLTITITNGSNAPHEVIYAVPNVRDDKGMTAEMVFDSGGGSSVPKMVKGSILPGESASGVVAFEIPEGTKSITADISAGTLLEDVKYVGPIG
ncbi:hypothetical protein ADK90_27835 [Streptomyces sp. XY413]|uniref:DUF4190 domain-containing protein n=2 Tax=unclassified Streptomyces TaxID=2593676 RepID=UPI0006AF9069|nr:DUF4190 domain-containing protein [Streptomyces sp. XY413]KOV16474.1 hypothetical protein ADK90_27835 [Streptomyces sp. XY413]